MTQIWSPSMKYSDTWAPVKLAAFPHHRYVGLVLRFKRGTDWRGRCGVKGPSQTGSSYHLNLMNQ